MPAAHDHSAEPRGRRKIGFWFRVVVVLLKPPLTVLTKRDWRGVELIPRGGGCVVVTNHVSHVDPLTFAHIVYDSGRVPRFLGKAEVFKVPIVGSIISRLGQIPVYRSTYDASRAYRAAVAAVQRGECVIIYPEGTITRDPDMWPMRGKTGAARVALATGVPVIPVAQWGPQHILPPYAKRPRLFPRKTIHVRVGPPVDFSAYQGRPLNAETLRQATETIMAAITEQLAKIRGEQGPAERFDARNAGMPETGNPESPRATSPEADPEADMEAREPR